MVGRRTNAEELETKISSLKFLDREIQEAQERVTRLVDVRIETYRKAEVLQRKVQETQPCPYCRGYATAEESESHKPEECTCGYKLPCGAGGCPRAAELLEGLRA